jgi:gas vesicle protein
MGKKLAVGAVVGAVAGLLAGVLMAPKSGKETRNDIKKRAEDLKQKAVGAVDDTKSAAKKLGEREKK